MGETVSIKYDGTALPADSTTETLFDTTNYGVKNLMQYAGLDWFNYRVDHSHQGIIKTYVSDDRGTNWSQHKTHNLAPHHGSIVNFGSFRVTGSLDFKAEWVNGGTTQTTFRPHLSLSCESDYANEWPLTIDDYVSGGNVNTTQNFSWIPVGPGGHVTMIIDISSGSSPTGDFTLEHTMDGGDTTMEVGGSSTEFASITADVTQDANWYNLSERSFVRLVYTRTSGTGTLNVQATSY